MFFSSLLFVEGHLQNCVPCVYRLFVKDHELGQKQIPLIPDEVWVNTNLRPMFKIEHAFKSCFLIERK